jgi:hypothetical protein
MTTGQVEVEQMEAMEVRKIGFQAVRSILTPRTYRARHFENLQFNFFTAIAVDSIVLNFQR